MPKGVYKREKWMKTGKHMLGRKLKKETIKKLKKQRKEEKNNQWKGDNAGIQAIHNWVKRYKVKPNYCEHCGTTSSKRLEWANKDHKYRRNLDDFICLCTSCHTKYDIKFNKKYESITITSTASWNYTTKGRRVISKILHAGNDS